MDSSRFDALTRRFSATNTRRGVVRGVAAVGLGLGLLPFAADAKKKRRNKKKKKRCKTLLQACVSGGKRKCCSGLECGEPDTPGTFACCRPVGAPCESTDECCLGGCVPPLLGGTGPSRCIVLAP
jgi:hypothetical protein